MRCPTSLIGKDNLRQLVITSRIKEFRASNNTEMYEAYTNIKLMQVFTKKTSEKDFWNTH